eukprot:261176-Amphidinium_carterae.1
MPTQFFKMTKKARSLHNLKRHAFSVGLGATANLANHNALHGPCLTGSTDLLGHVGLALGLFMHKCSQSSPTGVYFFADIFLPRNMSTSIADLYSETLYTSPGQLVSHLCHPLKFNSGALRTSHFLHCPRAQIRAASGAHAHEENSPRGISRPFQLLRFSQR